MKKPSSSRAVARCINRHCVARPHNNHLRISQSQTHPYSTTSAQSSSESTPNPNSSLTRPPRTIFSGIQPTGIPHIGNYLGALQQWTHLQNTSQKGDKLFFSVVDLHAITMRQDPAQLKRWKRETFASLLAVGLEPGQGQSRRMGKGKSTLGKKGGGGDGEGGDVTLFHQGSVSAHTDLMWILSCTASMGYLSRMTQWKSKLSLQDDSSALDEKAKSKLKLGLFSYPVLQAADVLVHRATHVPVGEDQSQHLEFARECVTNFNSAYGNHLVSPQTLTSPAKRVMSLQNPTSKMSKSDPNPNSRILITDEPTDIHRKIMAAVTDSTNAITYDPVGRREVASLIELLSHFDSQGRSAQELGRLHEGIGLGAFKKLLAETISEVLEPVRKRYQVFIHEDDGKYVDYLAKQGSKRAMASANETMAIVKEAMGLWV